MKAIHFACPQKWHASQHLIPVKESDFQKIPACDRDGWVMVWSKDGKRHGNLPALALNSVVDVVWSLDSLVKAGYQRFWMCFEDLDDGVFTFANRPSFRRSPDPDDRKTAEAMITVPDWLLNRMSV